MQVISKRILAGMLAAMTVAMTVAILGGCAAFGADGKAATVASSSAALTSVRWELISWSGHEVPHGAIGEPVILSFQDGEPGSVSGRAWCNRFSAPYVLRDAARLTIGHAAATRMACAERAMEFEAAFLDKLQALERFRIHDQTLELQAADGEIMILQAREK